MEIMKNLFDQSAENAYSPMTLPTDFQQLRRELMRDWKQAALESLGAMPVNELEEAPLLIAAAADEAVVIVSFADLDGSRMPENLVFAQENYTGLMVGFDADQAILDDDVLIYGPVWFFRCNDRGTICSVTAEDYYRIRRLCQLCRDTIYCLEADGTCAALRLSLKGYAPKD